jgi:hypothetical protein
MIFTAVTVRLAKTPHAPLAGTITAELAQTGGLAHHHLFADRGPPY